MAAGTVLEVGGGMQNGEDPKAVVGVSSTERQNHSVIESALAKPATSSDASTSKRNGTNPVPSSVQELSTVELVKQITTEVGHLAQKQVELAKAELKADLKSEAVMVGGLSLAALGAICTVNLLLVTGILALSTMLRGWEAGLIVSGVTLLATVLTAVLAWSRRVRSPMARTKRSLREDVEWTKERLV